jgi:hypothetical protein
MDNVLFKHNKKYLFRQKYNRSLGLKGGGNTNCTTCSNRNN